MRHAAIIRHLLLAVALLLAGALCTPEFVSAQDWSSASPGALNGPTRQDLQDTHAKLQKLQRRLAELSAAALKNNPPLQDQEEKLRNLVLNTMQAAGYEPKKEMARLQELTSKLRSEDIDPQQKKRLVADYRQARARLMAAQREALDNEEVQQAQQAYQDEMRQAMEKESPEAGALIQRYKKTQMKLQRQLEKAAKSQDEAN